MKKLKHENRIIFVFIFSFLSIFSLFNYDMKFSKNAEGRFKSVKFFQNQENKIGNNNFEYFKYFKWEKNYWTFIKNYNDTINLIKNNCDDISGVNLTDDTFLYILIGDQTLQKIPFYLDSSLYKLNDIFDKDLKNKIQKKVNDDSIYFITHKNNEKNIQFSDNYKIKKFINKHLKL